jgi:hypothetical protein
MSWIYQYILVYTNIHTPLQDFEEGQERRGFQEMHQFLATLPVPTPQESKGMTHAAALEGKFLPDLDEEQRKRFTSTELIMYRHAQEFRYIVLYTSISQYTHVYTVMYVSCDRWKAIELKKTSDMLGRPGFDSKELDPDLHERMQQAQSSCTGWSHQVLHQWYVHCYHMYIPRYTSTSVFRYIRIYTGSGMCMPLTRLSLMCQQPLYSGDQPTFSTLPPVLRW